MDLTKDHAKPLFVFENAQTIHAIIQMHRDLFQFQVI
jgi:hypothetical protein